jgi:hypothetical protein
VKNPFRSQSCCSIPLKPLTKVIENSTAKVGTPSGHFRGTANAKACEDKEEAGSGSETLLLVLCFLLRKIPMSTWDLNGFQAMYDCHVGKIPNDCNQTKAEAGSTLHEVHSIVLLVWVEHHCENN